ncbi:MAG: TadE/TadG family type IV pilus assembly protein [Planctomycetota bacterium]
MLRSRRRSDAPRGVAAVEFAIILPALVALTLGTMDLCSVIFLREGAMLAAYEGAREGVQQDGTNATATARVTEFLNARGIAHGSGAVAISNPSYDTAETLEHITITVTVPTAGNLISPSWLFAGMNVSASVTMRKEYEND